MKAEYNELLARYYKAEKYFESQAPYDEKIKHLESFKNILKGLNSLLLGIKDYKQEEILGGFEYGD